MAVRALRGQAVPAFPGLTTCARPLLVCRTTIQPDDRKLARSIMLIKTALLPKLSIDPGCRGARPLLTRQHAATPLNGMPFRMIAAAAPRTRRSRNTQTENPMRMMTATRAASPEVIAARSGRRMRPATFAALVGIWAAYAVGAPVVDKKKATGWNRRLFP
jgi:hypothetical protein